MIEFSRSGTTTKQVAEKFGVSVRSVTRLLHKHGVRRALLTSRVTGVIDVVCGAGLA